MVGQNEILFPRSSTLVSSGDWRDKQSGEIEADE
jgi:hypothetical protein